MCNRKPFIARSLFGTTVPAFFLAEVGEETLIDTIAPATRFHEVFGGLGGTALGMMQANLPVILTLALSSLSIRMAQRGAQASTAISAGLPTFSLTL